MTDRTWNIYEHEAGAAFISSDHIMQLLTVVEFGPGANPENVIAHCQSFKLVGQGKTEAEALRSLEAVLVNFLHVYYEEGKLLEPFHKDPWRSWDSSSGRDPYGKKGVVRIAHTFRPLGTEAAE